MITFVGAHADTITAIVAILGLLVAIWLGAASIKGSRDMAIADSAGRSEDRLTDLLVSSVDYQQTSLLPYWKQTPTAPVDPMSDTAREMHNAFCQLNLSIELHSQLTLRSVAKELDDLSAATWALYEAAIEASPAEIPYWEQGMGMVQPREGAISLVQSMLARHNASSEFREQVGQDSDRKYPGERVGAMQIADLAMDAARVRLVARFKAIRPIPGSGIAVPE